MKPWKKNLKYFEEEEEEPMDLTVKKSTAISSKVSSATYDPHSDAHLQAFHRIHQFLPQHPSQVFQQAPNSIFNMSPANSFFHPGLYDLLPNFLYRPFLESLRPPSSNSSHNYNGHPITSPFDNRLIDSSPDEASPQQEEDDDEGAESDAPSDGISAVTSEIPERKRMTRPLTGRYVKNGTGASKSTLEKLRRMIQEKKRTKTEIHSKVKMNFRKRKTQTKGK